MGWLKEKYTREYFLQKDSKGDKLAYGVYGVEWWEKGEIYPEGKKLLSSLDLKKAIVLDLGFGRGEAMKYCLTQGASYVVGVDFSEAAIEIASLTLKDMAPERFELICSDALGFLETQYRLREFTHILMLDVIEHIPRSETNIIIPAIYRRLVPGGCLVVHTPFYVEDDDVMVTGGKTICQDSSDRFEETKGMHINRYSQSGLEKQMAASGLEAWDPYIFLSPAGRFPIWKYKGLGRKRLARILGYKVI